MPFMGQWRRPWRDLRARFLYVATAIGLVSFVGATADQVGHSTWNAVYCGALGLISVPALWCSARCGIDVSETGVRVTRLLGRDVVPWSELAAVEVAKFDVVPEIVLRHPSGTQLRTSVYRDCPRIRWVVWLYPDNFDRLVADLRRMHRQHRPKDTTPARRPRPGTDDHAHATHVSQDGGSQQVVPVADRRARAVRSGLAMFLFGLLAVGSVSLPAATYWAWLERGRQLVVHGHHGTMTLDSCTVVPPTQRKRWWTCHGRFQSDDRRLVIDRVEVTLDQSPGDPVEGWVLDAHSTKLTLTVAQAPAGFRIAAMAVTVAIWTLGTAGVVYLSVRTARAAASPPSSRRKRPRTRSGNHG